MKKQKKISQIFLVSWSILTILILSFGTFISRPLINKLSDYLISKKANNVVLVTDLEVSTLDTYLVGTQYQLEIKPIPSTDENLGLEFRSLNEEVFTVSSSGRITGLRTSELNTTGVLEITSRKFPNLKKQIVLNFQKLYPDDVTIYLSHKIKSGKNNQVFVNTPFYINYHFESQAETYTERQMDIDFEHEMIEIINDNKLIAKKHGETKLIFSMKNGDTPIIVKEIDLEIKDVDDDEKKITEIRLLNEDQTPLLKENDKFISDVRKTGFLYFVNSEKLAKINYQIVSSDESIVSITNLDNLYFRNAGEALITIILDDQSIYELPVVVKNHLSLPIVNELENEKLILTNEVSKIITYQSENYGSNVKTILHFDEKYISVTSISNHTYHIYPKKAGTTTMKVIVDDGVTHLEKEYVVEIAKNNLSKNVIMKFVSIFISKFIGHLGFFFIEAILAIWMLSNYRNKRMMCFIIFSLIGISLAVITEFIQYFIPGRNGCIEDALFDIIVYYISGGIYYLIFFIIRNKKKKQNQSEEIS